MNKKKEGRAGMTTGYLEKLKAEMEERLGCRIDVVEDKGIRTAILNVSFTCHMPDCLEMPYMPAVRGAEVVEDEESDKKERKDRKDRD